MIRMKFYHVILTLLLILIGASLAYGQTITVILPERKIDIVIPDHEHDLPAHNHQHIHGPVIDPIDPPDGIGQAHLTWKAPDSRTDGSVLASEEIGGYFIYYTCETKQGIVKTADHQGVEVTEYTTVDLPLELCRFQVSVYDINGLESQKSNIVEKQISE